MESFMKQDNNIPEIDFVITWVDGNDPDWQKQKMEYSMQPDLSAENRMTEKRDTETGITFNTGSVVWSSLLRGYVKFIL